ncbi:hypothetical protein FA15DRAFT_705786 [Coprinopsis marcescibilis]|uniref:Hydrophobin n=1 Tax=Coprinopsis marcescibilis TaxID=230819 RepID=A0A5C3KRE8_COPMA|nr:hypothetical protein FA15DRAFT_705786 [Coprinopsis marcescibilis]
MQFKLASAFIAMSLLATTTAQPIQCSGVALCCNILTPILELAAPVTGLLTALGLPLLDQVGLICSNIVGNPAVCMEEAICCANIALGGVVGSTCVPLPI